MQHSNKNEAPTLLVVGRVGSVHGVRGAIRIYSETEPPEQILEYQPWHIKINHQWTILKIKSHQFHGPTLVVQFEGYTDRDQSKLLTGAEIAVEPSLLPSLPEGEYYWKDLIGLTVINLEGTELGVVTSLMETGSNDVLVVEKDGKDRLIPYIRNDFIKEIDLAGKRIVVDWDPDF